MRDAALWTEVLTKPELEEIDAALRVAKEKSDDLLEIGAADFRLPHLGARIARIKQELVNGRGVVRLRGVDRARYNNDELCLIYWGIGAHLGSPWAQNAQGHVLGDVTDQGKAYDDPTSRGNEIGGMKLPFHCDGSDLVGLMCLDPGAENGLSRVANAVSLHNTLIRERPDLATALYAPLPYDFRGEQKQGSKPFYLVPGFTEWGERLFMRLIPPYIFASQRHAEAPRLSEAQHEALVWINDIAESGRFNVEMAFEAGDMQFINNYHVLHGRGAYRDQPGNVRHLKRLWLETDAYETRPPYFVNNVSSSWNEKRVISRLDAVSAN
jgi:alpha-ketoglutarate-dependent taurine dioxygenase